MKKPSWGLSVFHYVIWFLLTVISLDLAWRVRKLFLENIMPQHHGKLLASLLDNILGQVPIVLLAVIAAIVFYEVYMHSRLPSTWFIGTLVIMMLFMQVGSTYLYVTYIPLSLGFVVRENNTVVGEVNCRDEDPYLNRYIANSTILCDLSLNDGFSHYELAKGQILQRGIHGESSETIIKGKSFNFTSQAYTVHIGFKMGALDQNRSLTLASGIGRYFPTLEEAKKRHEAFTNLLLALIAAILFSVPAGMKNLKDLARP